MEYRQMYSDCDYILRHQLIHDLFIALDSKIEVKPYIQIQNWISLPFYWGNPIKTIFGLRFNRDKSDNIILELADIQFFAKNGNVITTNRSKFLDYFSSLLFELKPQPNLFNGIDLYIDTNQTVASLLIKLLNRLFNLGLLFKFPGLDCNIIELFVNHDNPLKIDNVVYQILEAVVNHKNDTLGYIYDNDMSVDEEVAYESVLAYDKKIGVYKPILKDGLIVGYNSIIDICIDSSHLCSSDGFNTQPPAPAFLYMFCLYDNHELGRKVFTDLQQNIQTKTCDNSIIHDGCYCITMHIPCEKSSLVEPILEPVFQYLI